MKKRRLDGLKLNKRSISNLGNKKGGIALPPQTQYMTCGIGSNGACPTVDICLPLTADCITNNCETMYWCEPSNHPTCFESQDYGCFPVEI